MNFIKRTSINQFVAGDLGRFLGFWSVLTTAVFAYLGTELVGVTVGECQNPRKVIPRAIRLTFYRILLFYVLLVFLLGMIVPYNSPELLKTATATTSAAASPFVVAIQISGIQALPGIFNACVLVFVFSAANSGTLNSFIEPTQTDSNRSLYRFKNPLWPGSRRQRSPHLQAH